MKIENGRVEKDGSWEMDVIFESGQNYTYFGNGYNTKQGWYLEGCFTYLDYPKTEKNCFGSTGTVNSSGRYNYRQ